MSRTERVIVPLLIVIAAFSAVALLRTENALTDLKYERTVSCPRLLAQAGAPRAPGSPQDSGALAVAAAAVHEYEDRHCDQSGYGPVPPVYTGR